MLDAAAMAQDHFAGPVRFFARAVNGGKGRYREFVTEALQASRDRGHNLLFFLQDDVLFKKAEGLRQCIDLALKLDEVRGTRFGSLALLTIAARVKKGQWTGVKPAKIAMFGESLVRSQWVDGQFVMSRSALEHLKYAVPMKHAPVPSGSGLGMNLSRELHDGGFTMYHYEESPSICQGESTMHPEERSLNRQEES